MARTDTIAKEKWRLRKPGANTCGANFIDYPCINEAEAREVFAKDKQWTILEVRRAGAARFKVEEQRDPARG